jgi:hypothetical protein
MSEQLIKTIQLLKIKMFAIYCFTGFDYRRYIKKVIFLFLPFF